MFRSNAFLGSAMLICGGALVFGCSSAEGPDPAESSVEGSSSDLSLRVCRGDNDCIAPAGPCRQCADGVSFSCPEAICLKGRCGVTWTPCPESEPRICGGIAGIPCPTGFVCVDDPRDNCDPRKGGADCIGICRAKACDPSLICTQALTCVDGQLYPTGCGPKNCDRPLGPCDSATQ
jgi:hypothetical protein